MNVIWLASYPRSGNTFLRTILWHCFGLHSASVYPNDLGGNRKLEKYVGHIEHLPGGGIQFPVDSLPLIKTHEYPTDDSPAIYIVRDGRSASVSLWKFYNGTSTLSSIIEGRHRFGTWGNHIQAWRPWERPNTLLLEYESMRTDVHFTLDKLSAFLGRDVVGCQVPDRATIAGKDGRYVRKPSNWKSDMSITLQHRFIEINEAMMQKLGYIKPGK